MAVGTGFGQLFRGVGKSEVSDISFFALRAILWHHYDRCSGQVGGVGIASAIFQSKLDSELRRRITDRPDADEVRNFLSPIL